MRLVFVIVCINTVRWTILVLLWWILIAKYKVSLIFHLNTIFKRRWYLHYIKMIFFKKILKSVNFIYFTYYIHMDPIIDVVIKSISTMFTNSHHQTIHNFSIFKLVNPNFIFYLLVIKSTFQHLKLARNKLKSSSIYTKEFNTHTTGTITYTYLHSFNSTSNLHVQAIILWI